MAHIQASRPDMDIEADVEDIIVHYPPLMNDRHHLNVHVEDGAVTVTGHTRSAITREYLVDAVNKIAGVIRANTDLLFCDDDIRRDVGHLIPEGVYANVQRGVVVLTGQPASGVNTVDLTTKLTAVPGVRAVRTQFSA